MILKKKTGKLAEIEYIGTIGEKSEGHGYKVEQRLVSFRMNRWSRIYDRDFPSFFILLRCFLGAS